MDQPTTEAKKAAIAALRAACGRSDLSQEARARVLALLERLEGDLDSAQQPKPGASIGAFLFRCPNTGQTVQGWTADEVSADSDQYEAITCTACLRVHLVNPANGKVMGQENSPL